MTWRGLAWFWAAVLTVLVLGALTLEILGPPAQQPAQAVAIAPAGPRKLPETRTIAAPLPALLEPSAADPAVMLPRVAADGRMPRAVYARPADPAETRPKIGLVMSGLGMSESDSRAAIDALPGGVDLAVSPYANNPEPLLQAARARGHELLLSIPMEPAGYPLTDAGTQSLMGTGDPAANQARLLWALGRIAGYAGATGALGAMRGERFAEEPGAIGGVLAELGRRGLFYVDPRPGRMLEAAPLPTRAVDVVVDDPPARAELEAKLANLERMARERGTALALAGPPTPATIERIAAWARGLDERGIALVPVSALMQGK